MTITSHITPGHRGVRDVTAALIGRSRHHTPSGRPWTATAYETRAKAKGLTMLPQATPLYGYLWPGDDRDVDIAPEHVMVIGWEPEDTGNGASEYRPVMIQLDESSAGTACTWPDGWVWHLTIDPPSDDVGIRIKAQHDRARQAYRRSFKQVDS